MRSKRRRRLRLKRRARELRRCWQQRLEAGMLAPNSILQFPYTGGPFLGHLDLGVTFYRNT